jgi:hypothetical protein
LWQLQLRRERRSWIEQPRLLYRSDLVVIHSLTNAVAVAVAAVAAAATARAALATAVVRPSPRTFGLEDSASLSLSLSLFDSSASSCVAPADLYFVSLCAHSKRMNECD